MIIGIDGNEANIEKKVGISEFAYQLLFEFSHKNLSRTTFQIYLKNLPRPELPPPAENWRYKIVKPTKLWTQFGLPLNLYLKYPRPNVFFSPTHYAPRLTPVPSVISIMDLSYIHYPEMFRKRDLYQLKNWTLYSARNAAKIITISQSSKNDIIRYYFLSPEKIEVVYPGIKQELRIMNQELRNSMKKYDIHTPYILFVGTLQPRKNIKRLIEAFSHITREKEFKDTKLVIIGKKGWLFEEILKAPEEFQVEKNVKFLDFVSDEDLPHLYKGARCFVLPSLYEGFGLPVLEAMKHGVPVVTSEISSLPEAGGSAAVYFDPYNVQDIADKILSVIKSESRRKEMIEKGYKQVKKFSWEKAATQTLEILNAVAKK